MEIPKKYKKTARYWYNRHMYACIMKDWNFLKNDSYYFNRYIYAEKTNNWNFLKNDTKWFNRYMYSENLQKKMFRKLCKNILKIKKNII